MLGRVWAPSPVPMSLLRFPVSLSSILPLVACSLAFWSGRLPKSVSLKKKVSDQFWFLKQKKRTEQKLGKPVALGKTEGEKEPPLEAQKRRSSPEAARPQLQRVWVPVDSGRVRARRRAH